MRKWLKFFAIGVVAILIFIIFFKTTYKKETTGNNKSVQEIESYFLNVNAYTAQIEVTVISNKNVNFYKMKQTVNLPEFASQIITYPEDVAQVEITYENGVLEIKNSKYNLSKIYNDYPYSSDNCLFLTSFLQNYSNAEDRSLQEVDDKIEMSFSSDVNKYNKEQKLYINKSTLLPESLEIYDINNETKINIIYKEIEFNF